MRKALIPLYIIVSTLFFAACESDSDSANNPPKTSVIILNANPADDTSSYQIVCGVAADGASQVEFAIPYDQDNEVTAVTITELSESWGTLQSELTPPTTKNQLTAYRFTLTSSETLPMALRTSSVAELLYDFDIVWADGAQESCQLSVNVVRPPALFVHGLGSSAETFDTMLGYITPLNLFLGDALWAVDYSSTSLDSYDTNKNVVPNGISELRTKMATQGIVSERVTVIGHSMGGILTRIYMQGRSGVGSYRGDIHKLITINTPHYGSQLADFAIELGNNNPDGVIEDIAAKGAIVDLAVGSTATAEMNSAGNILIENNLDIPTHVIASHVGTTSDIVELVKDDKTIVALVTYVINDITSGAFYNGDTNDIVVPTESQEGGVVTTLRDNYIKTFSNQWHCSVLTAQEVASHILTLLDSESSVNYFTTDGFQSGSLTYTPTSQD